MRHLFYFIYWYLDLCSSWLGHRWTDWHALPSGMRKFRVCNVCAHTEADPPFPNMPRKDLKKAWAKRQKIELKLVKHTRNELGKDAN